MVPSLNFIPLADYEIRFHAKSEMYTHNIWTLQSRPKMLKGTSRHGVNLTYMSVNFISFVNSAVNTMFNSNWWAINSMKSGYINMSIFFNKVKLKTNTAKKKIVCAMVGGKKR